MSLRRQIAEELLGSPLVDGQYAPCPGKELHKKSSGKQDFRVILDGAPTGYCFHTSCGSVVDEFNLELRRRIWRAERGDIPAPARSWAADVAPQPEERAVTRPPVDMERVREYVRGVPRIDADWLRRRSPLDVANVGPGEFLNALYPAGERVLIFTDHRSQGDYLWWSGRGGYRLAERRGVQAVSSRLPAGAPEGVWYLVQPVSGQWAIKETMGTEEGRPAVTGARWTRRSQGNVTAWRYFVLESDELAPEDWLRVVVSLPVPIAAIYTSGGRSIHALVRCEVAGKAAWDATRNILRQVVCPLGADPAALTAVRLSRLPGCLRGQRMQELLYLCPDPDHEPLRLLPEVRR